MKHFNKRRGLGALLLTATLSLASGCGATATVGAPATPTSTGSGTNTNTGSGTVGTTTTGTSTGTGTSTDTNLNPPNNYTFTIDGGANPTYTTPAQITDTTLNVTVTPEAAGEITLPGYGFSATYGCLEFQVKVLDQSQSTGLLAVNGGSPACPNAASSVNLNFSSALPIGHTSASNPITVEVTNAEYDFYCQACNDEPYLFDAYFYGCQMYCPVRPLYKTHTVNAQLTVHLDGTS